MITRKEYGWQATPYAHVADNDLAVGMFIEALSQSPIWNETVVFYFGGRRSRTEPIM